MHICFKIVKFYYSLCCSLPPLHMQPLVTVCFCVSCVLQPCSVHTVQYQQSRAGGLNQHKITR
jgi:hypothetical protein